MTVPNSNGIIALRMQLWVRL